MSQSSKHQANHRHIDKSLACFWQAFVVLAQTTVASQPSEGALDNPPFGQHLETDLAAQFLDDLQCPTQVCFTQSINSPR